MKRFLLYWFLGLVLSCAWVAVASFLDVSDWHRGWWAGALSSAPFALPTIKRLLEPSRARTNVG